MKISEAVEKALKNNTPIVRKELPYGTKIYPTNSSDCCFVLSDDKSRQPVRCWNPTANDLVADDWEVATKE